MTTPYFTNEKYFRSQFLTRGSAPPHTQGNLDLCAWPGERHNPWILHVGPIYCCSTAITFVLNPKCINCRLYRALAHSMQLQANISGHICYLLFAAIIMLPSPESAARCNQTNAEKCQTNLLEKYLFHSIVVPERRKFIRSPVYGVRHPMAWHLI